MSENKELMVKITATAIELYEGDTLDAVLDEIEKKALVLVPDISTKKGREAIRTNAADVVGCKTYLFQMGKDLTEDHRKKVKTTNDVRNRMEERLNTLRDKVRKPLTEYETAEKERVAKVENTINLIAMMASAPIEHDSSEISFQLEKLKGIIVDDSFGDLETPAFIEKEKSIEKLTAQLETVKQREVEKTELEELRQMKAEKEAKEAAERAEKEQAERDKRIREEAAENATKEAAEREEKLKRELVEQQERAERQATEEKERIQRESAQREAKLIRDKEDAEKAVEMAALEERQKIEREQGQERIAAAKRESNKKHKAKINNAAVESLIDLCGCDADRAKEIVTAIAKGKVPNVKISY